MTCKLKGGVVLVFVLALVLADRSWAATYYVNTASTGGDGTTMDTSGAHAAFKTLSAAKSAVTGSQPDGALLLCKSCTWQETLVLGMSGAVGHPFTIGSYGVGAKPIIDATGRDDGIDVNGKSNVTIVGLMIQKADHNGIVAYGGGSGIIIDSCSLFSNLEAGLKAWSGSTPIDSWVVRNCEISYNQSNGIDMAGICTNWVIEKNSVHHNCLGAYPGGPDAYDWTAGIKLVTPTVTGNVIQRNDVWANGPGTGTVGINGLGIWLDTVGTGNVIRYNFVCYNKWSGIMNEVTSGTQIYYNLCWKNVQLGIYIFRSSSNNVVYNNACYSNTIGIGVTGDHPVHPGNMVGNLVKNNVSFGNYQSQLRVYFEGGGNVYEHNCLGPDGTSLVEWGVDNFISTYSAWESEYGRPTHSVRADPKFVSTVIPDFHLQSSSPCVKAGIWVGLGLDHDGNAVGNPPNVGIFEAQSSPVRGNAIPAIQILLLE